jgi:tape measure domain-containing protein
MAQGYYTLPEAAQALGMSVDELKQMAQKGQIR